MAYEERPSFAGPPPVCPNPVFTKSLACEAT
jgi:hypothetical protein